METVDEGFFGVGMYLDEESIGAASRGSLGQSRHQRVVAGGVAGIDDHWQVAALLCDWYGADVQLESSAVLKSPDSSLTQDNLVVPFCQQVIGCG